MTPFLLALLACAPAREDSGAFRCASTETAQSPDEPTPSGFTPSALLEVVEADFTADLVRDAGGSTPLHVGATRDGDLVWVDLEPSGDDGDVGAAGCEDHLAVPVVLTFATDDGAFAETFSTALTATAAAVATFSVDLVAEDLAGTFDPAALPTSTWDELYVYAEGDLGADGTSGVVAGWTVEDEGCTPDGTCSASSETLSAASWGDADPFEPVGKREIVDDVPGCGEAAVLPRPCGCVGGVPSLAFVAAGFLVAARRRTARR